MLTCPVCGRDFDKGTASGKIPGHGEGWTLCPGSYQPPAPERKP